MTNEQQPIHNFEGPLTDDQWGVLDSYLEKLPERVRLVVWAAELNSCTEGDAVHLGRTLAERYPNIEFRNRPRQPDYSFYPLLAVMGVGEGKRDLDYGIRFLGLPAWYQINSLIGAIQAVAFKGSHISPKTRILLSRLPEEMAVRLTVFTTPENESGVLAAVQAASFAVAHTQVRSWIVMANDFTKAAVQQSVYNVPHTVINDHYHLEGVYDDDALIGHIAKALRLPNSP